MSLQRLEVASLRKSAGLLQEALMAMQEGKLVQIPSECGYFALGQGSVWLAASPPPSAPPALAEVFWPGPLRLRLPGPQGKECWQLPNHPLAQALLAQSGPVAAHFLGRESLSEGLELAWKSPPLFVAYSEVDCACTPWRWLRTGLIARRELEWVAGQPTLLSGEALPREVHLPPAPVRARWDESWRLER